MSIDALAQAATAFAQAITDHVASVTGTATAAIPVPAPATAETPAQALARQQALDAPNAQTQGQKDFSVITSVAVTPSGTNVTGTNFSPTFALQFLYGDDTYDLVPATLSPDATTLTASYAYAQGGQWRVRAMSPRGTPSVEFPYTVTV